MTPPSRATSAAARARHSPQGGRYAHSTITTARGWIREKSPIAADIVDHWDEIVDKDG